MKVLLVKPHEHPIMVDIEPGLESLQKAVGGCIEAVYPFDDPVVIICHEEGKLLSLPLNRELHTEDGDIYDIIAGTFLVAGLGEEDFCELNDVLMEKYLKHFWDMKVFVQDPNGKIFAVPELDMDGGAE